MPFVLCFTRTKRQEKKAKKGKKTKATQSEKKALYLWKTILHDK
jgi:hypothetical protein